MTKPRSVSGETGRKPPPERVRFSILRMLKLLNYLGLWLFTAPILALVPLMSLTPFQLPDVLLLLSLAVNAGFSLLLAVIGYGVRRAGRRWNHIVVFNAIRVVAMLACAAVTFLLNTGGGGAYAVAAMICGLYINFVSYTAPERSYDEFVGPVQLVLFVVAALLTLALEGGLGLPGHEQFLISLFLYLAPVATVTINQSNLDRVMLRGGRRSAELPRGLRAYNAVLGIVLALILPLLYLLAGPLARFFAWAWNWIKYGLQQAALWLMSLFQLEDIEQEPLSETPPMIPADVTLGGNRWLEYLLRWLLLIIMALVIYRFRKPIGDFLKRVGRALGRWFYWLMHRELPGDSSVEEATAYTDYHSELKPERRRGVRSKLAWRQAYRQYLWDWKREPDLNSVEGRRDLARRYREAYRLALAWLDLNDPARETETAREIAQSRGRLVDERLPDVPRGFSETTETYETVRYGGGGTNQLADTVDALRILDRQLDAMARNPRL